MATPPGGSELLPQIAEKSSAESSPEKKSAVVGEGSTNENSNMELITQGKAEQSAVESSVTQNSVTKTHDNVVFVREMEKTSAESSFVESKEHECQGSGDTGSVIPPPIDATITQQGTQKRPQTLEKAETQENSSSTAKDNKATELSAENGTHSLQKHIEIKPTPNVDTQSSVTES